MKSRVIVLGFIFIVLSIISFSKDEICFKVTQYGVNGNIKDIEVIKNSNGQESIIYSESIDGQMMEDTITKDEYSNYAAGVRYYHGDMAVSYFILKESSNYVLYKKMEDECYSGNAEKIKIVDSNKNSFIGKRKDILLNEFTLNLYIEEGFNNSVDNYYISNVYLQVGKYYKVHLGEYMNYFEKRNLKDSDYKVPKDCRAYYGGWSAGQGTDLFILYDNSKLGVTTRLIDSEGSEEENSKLTDETVEIYCEEAKIKIGKEIRKDIDSFDILKLREFYPEIGKWSSDKKKIDGKITKIYRDKELIKVEDRRGNIYKEYVYFDGITFIFIKNGNEEKRYYFSSCFLFRYVGSDKKIQEEEFDKAVEEEAKILYDEAMEYKTNKK